MPSEFLIYGATGFVGKAVAEMAVASGLKPLLGGRDPSRLKSLADEMGLEYRAMSLGDTHQLDSALRTVPLVLNCAGPFMYTYRAMVEACLRTGTHYLDITGELPVFEALAALDQQAKRTGIMILPGVGFDVVPTDCLAVHLKNRLPTANHLKLAFQTSGPAGLPPGTQRTIIEMIPYGNKVRINGQLETPEEIIKTIKIDLGQGPCTATRITWGDVFTAWYSTGIPNIENYLVLPGSAHNKMKMLNRWRPVFRLKFVRNYLIRKIKPGPDSQLRAVTHTHIWGEASDADGRRVVSRLHGPEPGVEWTGHTALAVVRKILDDRFNPGFQTPGKVYGADLVMEGAGVTREDVFPDAGKTP